MSRRRIARCGAGRLCAIFFAPRTRARSETRSTAMKVSDILRFKGGTLYTATPELALSEAVQTMAGTDVGSVMDRAPLTCGPDTELDEVRRMMLTHHARYLPVLDAGTLMGVISFYDVAKAVVESQDFENRMLKAYIRDWPVEEAGAKG